MSQKLLRMLRNSQNLTLNLYTSVGQLENNGNYNSECALEDLLTLEDDVCEAQTGKLIRIAIIMNLTQMTSPILGYMVDSIGAQNFALLQTVGIMVGMVVVAFGIEVGSADFLLYLGFPLLSTCTWMGSLLIVQLGFYFQGHTASRVIFLLNTLFDSGAMTYWILWIIRDSFKGPMIGVWIGYMVFVTIVLLIVAALWRLAVPEEPPAEGEATESGSFLPVLLASRSSAILTVLDGGSSDRQADFRLSLFNTSNHRTQILSQTLHSTPASTGRPGLASLRSQSMAHLSLSAGNQHLRYAGRGSFVMEPGRPLISTNSLHNPRRSAMLDPNSQHNKIVKTAHKYSAKVIPDENDNTLHTVPRHTERTSSHCSENKDGNTLEVSKETSDLVERDNNDDDLAELNALYGVENDEDDDVLLTPLQHLTSTPYLLLCAFFGLQVLANNWNFSTQRDFLAYLGDDEKDNRYLTIFTLLTPVSIIGAPFMDYAILHLGWTGTLQMINALSLTYTIIKVVSEDLNFQIIGFVAFSFFRSFLFGVCFSFLPTFMAGPVIGVAAGFMTCIPGILSFCNIPMVNWAVDRLDGNFFIPNLFYVFLNIPCIFFVVLLGRCMQSDKISDDGGDATDKKKLGSLNEEPSG